jgi:hypothetical protein
MVKSSRFTGFITEHNAAYQWPTTHFVPIDESKTLCGLEIEKRPVDVFGFEQDVNQGDEPSCTNLVVSTVCAYSVVERKRRWRKRGYDGSVEGFGSLA